MAVTTDKTVLPNIMPPAALVLDGNRAENWKLFKQTWENYAIVTKLDSQDDKYRVAMFLHCVGNEALKIYNAFVFVEGENKDDLRVITKKFDEHIFGQTNETYERYIFNNRNQRENETIDVYLTELRTLAKSCGFCDCMHDSLIRDRVVLGVKDHQVRKRLLQNAKLTLNECLNICRSCEATTTQLKAMNSSQISDDSINKVKFQHKSPQKEQASSYSRRAQSAAKRCKFCGKFHQLQKELCPAWGKTCNSCHGRNHFSVKCPKRASRRGINALESDSEDTDFVLGVSSEQETVYSLDPQRRSAIHANFLLDNRPVKFQIDCGATVNVLPITCAKNRTLETCNKTLHMWNETKLKPIGKTRLILRNAKTNKKYSVEFIVVKENLVPLLGKRASEQMNLITINYEKFDSVATVGTSTVNSILNEYSDVFNDGLGTLPGTVTLKVDETISPQTSHPGRIPIALKPKVKSELDRLQSLGVIASVDQPTDWNSSIVVATKKSGDIRICLDPRPLNTALKRERFQLPVMDDLLPKLSNAKVFSKLDLTNGYWHVMLDEDSSYLTTFQTPFGRYRWLRLPFGTCISSEIFQKRLNLALDKLDGVVSVSDDILVYGSGETLTDAYANHDQNLRSLLQRCRERNIKLNKAKADICKSEISFLGHLVTTDGLKADPSKVDAIMRMSKPVDVAGVQRLNGTINYLAKFLPRLSEIMEPIRHLTCKDVEWQWTEIQDHAFDEMKNLVSKTPVLAYYNPELELVIQCDASQSGLGSTLLQNGQPIAYASRALTDVECRYAQIEKEMLAIVFSLERFHQYTFGRFTKIQTDHKPLESIIKKPLANAPKRLQGMLLRVQQYDIELVYCKGKDMILADMLSRAYVSNTENLQSDFEKVNMVDYLPIRDERIREIRQATDNDEVLSMLRRVVLQGWPDDKDNLPVQLVPYFPIRDEITVQDGLVFKGQRIIIPFTLRASIKQRIHSSHIGIDGCLRRARECVFWPCMNSDIKQFISTCETCRKFETNQPKETLMNHDIPDRQWVKIGVDLFEFDNKNYLVTVDYFSNFWEVDRLENTTAKTVIRKLKAHFARYGIPHHVVSDPGPQFTSSDFEQFAKIWDFEHLIVSPANQKANGKAESAVKTVKRLLRKAKDSNQDQFLSVLDFRNTPTQGIDSSPAQRMMNRRTRTLLPMTKCLLQPRTANNTTEYLKLKYQQHKQASYYNKTARDLPILQEGETVRMKPYVKGSRIWNKGVVNRRLDERSYEVTTDNGTYRRNRVQLRRSNESPPVLVPKPTDYLVPVMPNNNFVSQNLRTNVMPPNNPTASPQSVQRKDTSLMSQSLPDKNPKTIPRQSSRVVKPPEYLKHYLT